MKDINDLLKPRYKVIADYPGSDFEIGAILTKYGMLYDYEIEPGRHRSYSDHMIEGYSHLFQKLEWWQDRKPEEMPKYVKSISGHDIGRVYKVANPNQDGRVWHIDGEIEFGHLRRWAAGYMPITLEEYNSYINSKNP